MDFSDTTVGVPTFRRKEKLFNLLESLEKWDFKEIIVADDSKISEEKWNKYEEMKEKIPLRVLEFPFDSGIGKKRQEIVKELESNFLLTIDDDMEPYKIKSLKEVLLSDEKLGGVSGLLIEENELKCSAHDLKVKNSYLIKDIKNKECLSSRNNNPYFKFNQIPQVGIFRKDCLNEYNWDDHYKAGKEHLDFFFGHYKKTDWEFAVTPTSLFGHFPGGSSTYTSFRRSKNRMEDSKRYFLDKWGLKGILEYRVHFVRSPNFKKNLEIALKRKLPFTGVRLLQWFKDKVIRRIQYA